MSEKIRVEDVSVIFGKPPKDDAVKMMEQGVSKNDILEKTGKVVGVANASFTVKAGEIFVVMGLSGSGKSTLIRCVNRLIEPTTGKIFIDDEDVLTYNPTQLRELRRTKIAMVFQHFALMPHKTVIENVGYGLQVRGVSPDERREVGLQALDLVGLKQWADKYPSNLSGGMQQRVGLARALATDADILLMDEAFSALDPLIRRQMQNELLQLQETLNKTILFITHDLNEALRVGTHVAVMRDGQIVQIGNPIEIITKPANDYVAAFMQDVDQSRVLTAEVVMQPAAYVTLGQNAVENAYKRARGRDDVGDFYVVDRHQKVAGLINSQKLLKHNPKNPNELLEVAETDNVPHISLDTPLSEMYAVVSNGVPVAVVDAQGRLVGMVSASDVLGSLATIESTVEELEEAGMSVASEGTADTNGETDAAAVATTPLVTNGSADNNDDGHPVTAPTGDTELVGDDKNRP